MIAVSAPEPVRWLLAGVFLLLALLHLHRAARADVPVTAAHTVMAVGMAVMLAPVPAVPAPAWLGGYGALAAGFTVAALRLGAPVAAVVSSRRRTLLHLALAGVGMAVMGTHAGRSHGHTGLAGTAGLVLASGIALYLLGRACWLLAAPGRPAARLRTGCEVAMSLGMAGLLVLMP